MSRALVFIAVTAMFAAPASAQVQQQIRILPIHPPNPPVHDPHGYRHVRVSFPSPEQRADNLAQLLGLSSEQKDRIQAIFIDQDKRSTALWDDTSLAAPARIARLEQLRDETVQKVRPVLSTEQRKKYDAIAPAKASAEKPRLTPDGSPPD
jgi:hypothetical protein